MVKKLVSTVFANSPGYSFVMLPVAVVGQVQASLPRQNLLTGPATLLKSDKAFIY